jgi:hypothetical protein
MANEEPAGRLNASKFRRIMWSYVAVVFVLLFLSQTAANRLMQSLRGRVSDSTILGVPVFNASQAPVNLGVVAMGPVGVGVVAFGGLSIGLVSFGGLGIGVIAVGGGAVGVIAVGGGACGLIAIGGGAFGFVAIGGGACGVYVFAGGGYRRHRRSNCGGHVTTQPSL